MDIKDNSNKQPDEDNIFKDEKYISFLYSNKRRPNSNYPDELAVHLRDHYFKSTGDLLDIGCGRGDMLKALFEAGFSVSGTDLSPVSIDTCKPHTVKVSNLEKDSLPFDDNAFDFVFSKSVIEHLHNPMSFLKQSLRVIAPGGRAVIMTPSWMHTRWGPFYLDYTHVTPFTRPSLRDAMVMAGYTNVKVVHFHQLPFLWKRPWMTPLVRAFAQLPLRYSPMHDVNLPQRLNTFFRFSKEVMLLGIGDKPEA